MFPVGRTTNKQTSCLLGGDPLAGVCEQGLLRGDGAHV